jgi:hypothetical protein
MNVKLLRTAFMCVAVIGGAKCEQRKRGWMMTQTTSKEDQRRLALFPEMLEALKAMREAFKNVTLADDELLANQLAASVIAKAEGKS